MINLAHSLSRNYQNLPFTVCIWIQQLTWFQCIPFWIRTLLKSACVWKYHSMIFIQIMICSFYLINGISVYRYCESREYKHLFIYCCTVVLSTTVYLLLHTYILPNHCVKIDKFSLHTTEELKDLIIFLCDSMWLYVQFVHIFSWKLSLGEEGIDWNKYQCIRHPL